MINLQKEILLNETGLLPPLVSDYINGDIQVSHLYKYPFDISAFADVIRDKSGDTINRKLLVDVLQSQYGQIPTTEQVTANIESLASNKTFVITAAHQPCLLLGPLYNIYKIASAIHLSKQLKQAYPGYHFVPLFWLGSEDHDIEELCHTYIDGNKLEWTKSGTGPVGRLKTDTLRGVIEDLRAMAPGSPLLGLMEEGVKKYNTFGRLSQYLVNELFKEHGLVVLDQDDTRLKKNFADIIKEEILHTSGSAVLQDTLDYLERNYKMQAKPREINFFYLGDGYRERIIFNHLTQRFEIKNKRISFDVETILDEIDQYPERFSPNVIYRPIYQEFTLPNLAFIGGAGELSYWLELRSLFEHYQLNFPMLVHRTSAAIINTSVLKKMEKLNLQFEDFFGDLELLVNRYVSSHMSADVSLNDEKEKVTELYDLLASKAGGIDITLMQNVSAEKQKVLASLENIGAKILKAEKRKQESAVGQIRSIHAALFLENVLQERKEGVAKYCTKDFIDEMVFHANPFDKSFKIFSQTSNDNSLQQAATGH